MEKSIVLGVDIGGSHITSALVNLETQLILEGSKVRNFVNSKGTKNDIIDKWIEVISSSFATYPVEVKKIGIAMPGPFNYEEGISLMQNQDKYDALYGLNIKSILSERLNIDPLHINFLNDAECFLKGEVFCGAAKGVKNAIGLTLGTGLGSSIYKDGNVKDADLWNAPFLDSIAEEYLSTRWFTKKYSLLTGNKVLDVKELVEMKSADKIKKEVFDEFGKNLASFLNAVKIDKEPEAIVLGGNISNAYYLFEEKLKGHLSHSFSKTKIHKTELGEDSCLIGAASSLQIAQLVES